MIELSPSLIHALLEARDACAGVSTDTRAQLEGTMYFALRGASFDGNAFVQQALESGATHAVTTDTRWKGTAHVTVVTDELGALQRFAWAYRKRWSCPVLGMTGSNGKTTTKELIRDVLATTRKVHATLGNLNNHIGVPLTLLNAPPDPEFVVVEMGANHQGEIAQLAAIAAPTHGYITNIGLAHLEGFGGAHGVYLGKKELFDYLAETKGLAFVQTADTKVTKAAEKVRTQVDVDTHAWTWRQEAQGGARVHAPDGRTIRVHLEGAYNLANVVAAVRIGEHFGVPFAKASEALTAYLPQNHRSQAVQTSRNWVLLDAYNANPSSVANALADFGTRNHEAPLVLLGDMAELGEASLDAHRDVVHQALKTGAELWTVGPWFGKVHAESPHKGWIHWEHFDALADRLNRDPLTGRQILVKGSRSAALERVMPYL